MKTNISAILLLILISLCFSQNVFSQDYLQWGLPEGAKMRIGKGEIYGKIAFSPDGSVLAAASSIGIWIYDGYTGKELKLLTADLDYDSNLAFSPDGKTVACSNSNELYLWDIDTGNIRLTIAAHSGGISGVAFNPNGETVATSSSYNKDGAIKFWDVSDGSLKYTIVGHESGDDTINFSPDGKFFASLGDTGTEEGEGTSVRIWSVATWELKTSFVSENNWHFFAPKIVFSPDGNTLAACSGDVRSTAHIYLWNIASNSLINTLIGHTGGVYDIAFSPDGKTLASSSFDKTICLWDTSNGERKTTIIAPHTDYITSVAYSPDGKTLASYGKDGTIILWDTENFEPRTTITGHFSGFSQIAFSPDGKTLVSGSRDKTLRLWDTTTGRNIKTFVGHIGPVISVAFSPDGRTIASSGGIVFGDRWFAEDSPIRLWDVSSGSQIATILGQRDGVYLVSFSPDGQSIVTYSIGKKPVFWDATTTHRLWTFTGNWEDVGSMAFSPDGRKIVYGNTDGIYLWDAIRKKQIARYTGSIPKTTNIVFSPDGHTIAAGGVGQEMHLWDVYTGERNTIITGHDGLFKTVLFSPDGKTILTAGDWDERLQFWDAETGDFKLMWRMPKGIHNLAFSPDGKTLASSHEYGAILLWDYGSSFNTTRHVADVNDDGVVDIQDLVVVAANFGKTGNNNADVNGDGSVNIADLILVAGAIENAAATPTPLGLNKEFVLTKSIVQNWITQARSLDLSVAGRQKGIQFLEQLLLALVPEKTALLPNYPNPFNPETWIPYQLSEVSNVKIEIYSSEGQLIRTLDIGEQAAGLYQNKDAAVYWDGKNDIGESVSSGVYFYTLTAGQYSATRKMLIRK